MTAGAIAPAAVTLWVDDDHGDSEDERPLASLTWITSSPEFSPSPKLSHAKSRELRAKSDVDDVQLVKIIPAVVDLVTPPRARPPASPLRSDCGAPRVKTEAPEAKRPKAEVVTPTRPYRPRVRVKTELFTPKRVLRVRREMKTTPSKRKQREKLAALFGEAWSRSGDGATRKAVAELLGLAKAPPKAVTYVAWAALRDAKQEQTLAAAILSVYRFRGKRRCGCLEFIVSRSRGVGSRLLHLAARFLKTQNVWRLFSGVDLSQPYAMAAHNSWGFRTVTQHDWAEAGLASYSQGDVCYTVLDLDRCDTELAHQPNSELMQ